MKKLISTLIAISTIATSSFAFEWGGIFYDKTGVGGPSIESAKIDQKNLVDLWTRVPLSKSGTSYIAAEANYSFEFNDSEPVNKVTNIVDLILLKYGFNKAIGKKSIIDISVGRFSNSDITGKIYNQISDGARLAFGTESINLTAFAGYTGLLNSLTTTIITPEHTNYTEKGIPVYTLAPAYLPASLSFTVPSLFANQNLKLQVLGCFDFNNDNFNRYYATAGLSGKLVKGLFYNLNATVSSENFQNISLLSNLYVRYSPVSSLSIVAEGLYASGNNGPLTPFRAISFQKASLSQAEPDYSGLIKANLGIIATLKDKFLANANVACLFNCMDSDIKYDGFQWKVDCAYNIFNDLRVGAELYQYVASDPLNNAINLSLNATIAF